MDGITAYGPIVKLLGITLGIGAPIAPVHRGMRPTGDAVHRGNLMSDAPRLSISTPDCAVACTAGPPRPRARHPPPLHIPTCSTTCAEDTQRTERTEPAFMGWQRTESPLHKGSSLLYAVARRRLLPPPPDAWLKQGPHASGPLTRGSQGDHESAPGTESHSGDGDATSRPGPCDARKRASKRGVGRAARGRSA